MGERLTLPTSAELVDEETAGRFFQLVSDLIDWQYQSGNAGIENFSRIRSHAEDIWDD
jgi:hypothetical protein